MKSSSRVGMLDSQSLKRLDPYPIAILYWGGASGKFMVCIGSIPQDLRFPFKLRKDV